MYINIQQISKMQRSNVKYCSQKIQKINESKQKYKRSTNNSHKKFICVARKLLYKYCTYAQREMFEKHFQAYQNSRVYYFIILCHVKIRMCTSEKYNFKRNLITLLQAKIQIYNSQIAKTNNKNFINFRFEEIADIQFAINALHLYFDNQVEQAIEAIYKKEKGFILKKQQYQMAIQTVMDLQNKLQNYPQGELFPYLHQKSEQQEIQKTIVKGKTKGKEDEEWVWEKRHEQNTKKSIRKQRNKQNKSQSISLNINTPLLFLQNSYEYNPNFFNILFSYQPHINNLHDVSSFHNLHATHIPAENTLMQPYNEQSLHQYSHYGHYQDKQVNMQDDDMGGCVKRQEENGKLDYFGFVKSEFKEKEGLLIPPQTTKEDASFN